MVAVEVEVARLDERVNGLEDDRRRQNGTLLRLEDKIDKLSDLVRSESNRSNDITRSQSDGQVSRATMALLSAISIGAGLVGSFLLHMIR